MEWVLQYFELIIALFLLVLGYSCGRLAEKRHYKSIFKREKKYQNLLVFTVKTPPEGLTVTDSKLVAGSVVVSIDYFKKFVAGLRMIIGGRLRSYETLVDRGRREAVLRMKEQALLLHADSVVNVKIETSSISKGRRGTIGSIEVCAYGTALKHA